MGFRLTGWYQEGFDGVAAGTSVRCHTSAAVAIGDLDEGTKM